MKIGHFRIGIWPWQNNLIQVYANNIRCLERWKLGMKSSFYWKCVFQHCLLQGQNVSWDLMLSLKDCSHSQAVAPEPAGVNWATGDVEQIHAARTALSHICNSMCRIDHPGWGYPKWASLVPLVDAYMDAPGCAVPAAADYGLFNRCLFQLVVSFKKRY